MVKSLPAMWETWVQSLGQEDPLEKEMTVPRLTTTGQKVDSGPIPGNDHSFPGKIGIILPPVFPGGPVAKTPCFQRRGEKKERK